LRTVEDVTLQYNITHGQLDRPLAVAVSLGLHGLAVAAALMAFGPMQLATDDSAAITIYVEPDVAPIATPTPVPVPDPEPEPEPNTASMRDYAPSPPEELPLPDFSMPSPPPKPAKPAPRPAAQSAPAERAPPAPAASGPAVSAPATVAPGWSALLAAWLAANRRYPEDARRRSEEGEVTVRFTVDHDGRVLEAAVVKGSGFAALDAAALRLLQGATLPAPGTETTRTVRIRFRLGD